MTRKDVLELKRRFKKDNCTITQLCGCYVNSEKNKISLISVKNFLNLDDDEFFKYLDIAKKVLSGKFGNNIVPLDFPTEEECAGGKQQFLMGIRASHLENEDLLNTFYDRIIESYDNPGNYLILLFHDSYDVICKASDNSKLDESDEIFEYILCAICPVKLSEAALGYRQDENRIAPRIRDWVVKAPETGFLFPSFSDRSTDIHSVTFYTKNSKKPHVEFAKDILGCEMKMTSDQKKQEFSDILMDAIGDGKETESEIYMEIQKNLNDIIEQDELNGNNSNEKELTSSIIQEAICNTGLSEEQMVQIEDKVSKKLPENSTVEEIIDTKALEDMDRMRYISELKKLLTMAADELSKSKGEDNALVTEIRAKIR